MSTRKRKRKRMSPAARRMERMRARRREGREVVVQPALTWPNVESLVEVQLLDAADIDDRDEIARAVERLVDAAPVLQKLLRRNTNAR